MGHYISNTRDDAFNFFDIFDGAALLEREPFEDLDEATVRAMIDEVAKLAETAIAESFIDSDRNPPQFDPGSGSVTLPASMHKSWKHLRESEWWRVEALPELGGQLVPRSVVWAIAEQFLGANPALQIYTVGVPFAGIVWRNGTEAQKLIAEQMIAKGWTSTMMLTEPEAGSDVGAGTTRAERQPDGSWHLTGVKRFISSGDHDLSDNIIHLVLARPVGAGAGTKGLSLFVVPKFHFDWATGELGERNGIFASNLESKMGLVGSATCEMRLGEDPSTPAVGYLLGEVHNGIAQMFEAIEHSRMFVGVKAVATLSAGYAHALAFAKDRVQSGDLARLGDKGAPSVPIISHPDVRRSLMRIKAHAEGMRFLVFLAAHMQDNILVSESTGRDSREQHALNDLLLPIVKGYCSERAYELLGEVLQTLGGSGYLKDYPIEQYLRDAKIDTLYEGTTAIQGQDFFFRKIVRNKGEAINKLLTEIETFANDPSREILADESRQLKQAAADFRGMLDAMLAFERRAADDGRCRYLAGQHTTRLLMSAGDLLLGYGLLRQAAEAQRRLADEEKRELSAERGFLLGKLAAARFFCRTVLPTLASNRSIVERADNDLMDIDASVF